MAGLADAFAAIELSFMSVWSAVRSLFESRSYGKRGGNVQRYTVCTAFGLLLSAGVAETASAAERTLKIIALGDSLTAGYQLPPQAAFPVQLEQALRTRGHAVEIVNAGVSGDTSSGGLARLDWSVPPDTDGVILQLGANDALRGVDPKVTREALAEIVRRLKTRHIEVLLCGMLAPRNLGAAYAKAFDPIYPELAAANELVFYPFFLYGVATDSRLNQSDGLHPTAAGVARIVSGILPKAESLLARIKAKPAH